MSVCPYVRPSVRMSVRPSVRPLCLTKRGLDCSLCDRRTKIAGDMYFDVFFHMRSIPTPKNVLDPPFGGSNPPFSVFSYLQKNYSPHKKYVETKVVDLKELISGNFNLRTISLQITNLWFLKTFACAENRGMRIIYYSCCTILIVFYCYCNVIVCWCTISNRRRGGGFIKTIFVMT